jgi:serine/threonine protein kinase
MSRETTPFVPAEQETLPPLPAATPAPRAPDPFPGEFRLLRRLGAGAFGEVWLAEDLSPLGRLVALKFLHARPSADDRAGALAALQTDARVLASLRHPHIVQVYSWRQPAGSSGPCLVLQYVAGGSLEDRVLRDGALPWHLAARYVADVGEGLLQVHARGIIHRDVKPANVLWDPERDEALLTDFGVAARLTDPAQEAGTPLFMAPEGFRGELSPALDVYSLAATLFWLVAAQAPFRAADKPPLVRAVLAGLPDPDPRCAGLPAALERLIRAGLSPRAAERPSLADFTAALRGSLNLLLADALTLSAPAAPGRATPVDLRLLVSRQVDAHTCVPVAASQQPAERCLRDFRRVPAQPQRVTLHTGDRVRLEVAASHSGYVTVFNVGPSGNLNLLYPADLSAGSAPLEADRPLHILDVELTPPVGHERLFALWTRRPLPLRPDELRSLVEQGPADGLGPYRATRDMVRVQQSVQQLSPEDRHVVVLELDHR